MRERERKKRREREKEEWRPEMRNSSLKIDNHQELFHLVKLKV